MLDRLKEIIGETLIIDVERLNLDTDFIKDLTVDSLDMLQLSMRIEDEFDVEIPDEELENLMTIGDVYELLKSGTGA